MCEGNNQGTHTDAGQYAWDFCMPIGTPVLASRGGVVRGIQQSFDQAGWGPEFADKNNYVVVDHGDQTSSLYMHLMHNGVRVQVGQVVQAGQLLAYSGNTGWSHGPHTHFMVMNGDGSNWYAQSLPVAFADVPGDGVPVNGGRYTSGNASIDPGLLLPPCSAQVSRGSSGFSPFWVENFIPSTLWSGQDAGAVSFGAIGPWQSLQVVAPQAGSRLQVRVMSTGGTAFVPAQDVGPSGPPETCQH